LVLSFMSPTMNSCWSATLPSSSSGPEHISTEKLRLVTMLEVGRRAL
jgi:hypothetical protein